jgi:hypothetical protein
MYQPRQNQLALQKIGTRRGIQALLKYKTFGLNISYDVYI